MIFTYNQNLPTSFDDLIRVSEQAVTKIREQIFAMAEPDSWYNLIDGKREYFVLDYLKLIYERAAEQYNELPENERYRFFCISNNGTFLAYHSGLYSRDGSSLFVSIRYDELSDSWELSNLTTEIDCDYFYGNIPEPIDFDEFRTQFYSSLPIDDGYLSDDVLAEIEEELPVFLRLRMTSTVWETAKTMIKRDPSRAIPVYRAGKMRFLVPLLYRKSDYVDMCIELTADQEMGGYKVTGYHDPAESYILARRMGPVRNYWLIKRSEVFSK